MKKMLILSAAVIAVIVFANCSAPKKVAATPPEPAKLNYAANVHTVITTYCTPCHIPSKGGNKKPYDNFANVKSDIDEIIRRVELTPGTRGFMPLRQPKLSDSTINILKQWKQDGLLEQ